MADMTGDPTNQSEALSTKPAQQVAPYVGERCNLITRQIKMAVRCVVWLCAVMVSTNKFNVDVVHTEAVIEAMPEGPQGNFGLRHRVGVRFSHNYDFDDSIANGQNYAPLYSPPYVPICRQNTFKCARVRSASIDHLHVRNRFQRL